MQTSLQTFILKNIKDRIDITLKTMKDSQRIFLRVNLSPIKNFKIQNQY